MYSDFGIGIVFGQSGEGFLPLSNDTNDLHQKLIDSNFATDRFSLRKMDPERSSSCFIGERVEGILGYQQGRMRITEENNGFAADSNAASSGETEVIYKCGLQHEFLGRYPHRREPGAIEERLENIQNETVTFKPANTWSVKDTESCMDALSSKHPGSYAYNRPTYQRQEALGSGVTLIPLTEWDQKDRYMTEASATCDGDLYIGDEHLGSVTTRAHVRLVADVINPDDFEGTKGTVGMRRVLSMIPDRSSNAQWNLPDANPAWGPSFSL